LNVNSVITYGTLQRKSAMRVELITR